MLYSIGFCVSGRQAGRAGRQALVSPRITLCCVVFPCSLPILLTTPLSQLPLAAAATVCVRGSIIKHWPVCLHELYTQSNSFRLVSFFFFFFLYSMYMHNKFVDQLVAWRGLLNGSTFKQGHNIHTASAVWGRKRKMKTKTRHRGFAQSGKKISCCRCCFCCSKKFLFLLLAY